MTNSVDVLIVGFVEGERATGTVSLVRTPEAHVILVDCGDPWNGEELKGRLAEKGFAPDQVTDVVITHGHIDHCGNANLFKNARFFMDGDWARDGLYGQRENVHSISPSVRIVKRVGHTSCDLILVVDGCQRGGTTVVAGSVKYWKRRPRFLSGDLFEDENDEEKWRGNSQYSEEHEESREYVRKLADWIVPGHGDIFQV
ncbi:hypothetical protein PMAYCL1PPCAC_01752, partial [Pristionchus mayeri]